MLTCSVVWVGLLTATATIPANTDATPAALAVISHGEALIARGDLSAALRIADGAEAAGSPTAVRAAAETVRALVDEARDALSDEAAHYTRALDWARRAGSPSLVARAFDGVEDAFHLQGHDDLVIALATRLLDASPTDPNRGMYFFRRGMGYSEMHDAPSADRDLREALRLAEAAQQLELIGKIHYGRGLWTWRYQRDFPRALHEYDLAVAFGRRARSWRVLVSVMNGSGNLFRADSQKNLPEALRRYQEGLAIARRAGISDAFLLKNIGDVYRQMGRAADSERALDEALRIADKGNVNEVRWMARLQLAMLCRDRDPARAERYFAQSIDLVEAQQSGVLLQDFRAGALAGRIIFADPYDEFIDFLLATHQSERAFVVAERQRARVFLDMLSGARDTLVREVPAAFAAAERDLLDRLKGAQASLRTEALADASRRELAARVDDLETRLTQLHLRLAVERPLVAHARYPRLWAVGELQSTLLQPDEALLAVYLGRHRSVAWIVTRAALRTVLLPPRDAVERLVRPAVAALRDPVGRDRSAMAALSRALAVDDLTVVAGATRLVVVPHGVLNDVPFEALVDAAGRALVERFVVSYAPSAASLAFLRSTRRRAPAVSPALIAVANPIVGGDPPTRTRQADLTHLNLLTPVPYSAEEARQVAKLFAPSAEVLDGARATAASLRGSGLERARMVHFATHGLIDEDRPERSGLVLTAGSGHDDGLLQTRDIYGLRLDADLVTLSACETALGQNVSGEGIIGLTRAFFYAGARAVVASLWDIEDASTARLMQRFYANIRRGEPIDAALQHAKIDFVRGGGDTARPFFWASFIVSGQARAVVDVPEAPRAAASAEAVAIAIATIVAAAAWMYRRRRQRTTAGVSRTSAAATS